MKQLKIKKKKSFLKKLLIQINRLFGFEIIDQSNYSVEGIEKYGYENLSIIGKQSTTLPLGEFKISRKVNSLHIIFRSCASVKMLSQSKERVFSEEKQAYSIRSLNSIVKSLNQSKQLFNKIGLKLTIIDHESSKVVIEKYKKILNNQFFNFDIKKLEFEKYKMIVNNINQANKKVSENQKSNMSNIGQSLDLSLNSDDLIYFVEDDYIHKINSIEEMIYTYEKFSSLINNELFLCPTDYPYLYINPNKTNVLFGNKSHWRRVDQTLCTFLTSKKMIEKYFDNLKLMTTIEHVPFEKPLHDIFSNEYCFSPIPSLAIHFTNINSIYGISPNENLNKLWSENEFIE